MTADPVRSSLLVIVAGGGLLSRAGVERIVRRDTGMELGGACADLQTAALLIESIRPHVVVSDVRLAPNYETEGVELALELAELRPHTGVVLLSDTPDPAIAAAFFSAGAVGRVFLMRAGLAADRDLTRAIDVAARGGSLLDPAVVGRLRATEADDVNGGPSLLTARDRAALMAIADDGGRTNRLTR